MFNNGEIRLFMFLGILLGSLTYMIFLSSYIIKINVKIITFVKTALKKLLKLIFMPIIIVYKFVKKILFKPINIFIINIRKISTKCVIKNFFDLKRTKKIVKN